MERLTVKTDLPQRRPSKNTSLSPSSAWSAVSKPFQSKPKLSSGVMSSWIDKQNEDAFAQNKRIFYVPGLSSTAKSTEATYTRMPTTNKWEFKGIPVVTVDTHMPPTGSELDLRTEMDFWETVVPDKSPQPKEGETPVVAEDSEVLFDANDEHKDVDDECADDAPTCLDELQIVSPRPLSPVQADDRAEPRCGQFESRMLFQPQLTPNPHISRTQSGRILISKAWSCCGIRPAKASEF